MRLMRALYRCRGRLIGEYRSRAVPADGAVVAAEVDCCLLFPRHGTQRQRTTARRIKLARVSVASFGCNERDQMVQAAD